MQFGNPGTSIDARVSRDGRTRTRLLPLRCGVALLFCSALLPAADIGTGGVSHLVRANVSPAPRADAGVFAIPSNWYDVSTRPAAVSAWNDLVVTRAVPIGFTGDVGNKIAGTTSQGYQSAVTQRINWFRAMAGVPASISLNPTLNAAAQQGALMLAVQGSYLHSPRPQDWPLYFNQSGFDALNNSITCAGAVSDPGCIEQYMTESGTSTDFTSVGHRRFLLNPVTQTMATGDVPVNSVLYNAVVVYGQPESPSRSARDEFVAWPPKGFVPYQVVYPRWSFSYPGADFSQASVVMTTGGSQVGVTLETVFPGLAENTIAWQPAITTGTAPVADTAYNVTVNNVIVGGSARSFSYTVTVIDPAVSGSNCTFGLSSNTLSAPASGSSSNVTLTATGTNCTWSASSNKSWAQIFPLSGTGTTPLSYTVYPNFSTSARSATITAVNQPFVVNQQAATGTPDERFVGLLYFNFFGRLAAPSEIAFQVQNALQQGTSRAELASRFLNSQEFNIGGRFVAGLYVGILNRDAEYGGWLFQRNAFATGFVTQTQLVANFLGSQEFIDKNGTPSNAEFVRLIYRQILGREATQNEVDTQAAVLQGGRSRVDMTTDFLNSQEFRQGTQARLTAFLLYAALLNRAPQQAELDFRRNQLNAGSPPLTSIIGDFVGSGEFNSALQ